MKDNNIDSFDEKKTIEILKQLRDGFQALRKKSVIHRDLKLSNLFMHNDHIVIGNLKELDFIKKGILDLQKQGRK